MKLYTTAFLFLITLFCNSQDLIWTGNAGTKDFFDEANWLDTNSNLPPGPNTLNSNQVLNLNLIINNSSNGIIANGIINLGNGSLTITKSNITAEAVSGGTIEINIEAYVDLNSINISFYINFNCSARNRSLC